MCKGLEKIEVREKIGLLNPPSPIKILRDFYHCYFDTQMFRAGINGFPPFKISRQRRQNLAEQQSTSHRKYAHRQAKEGWILSQFLDKNPKQTNKHMGEMAMAAVRQWQQHFSCHVEMGSFVPRSVRAVGGRVFIQQVVQLCMEVGRDRRDSRRNWHAAARNGPLCSGEPGERSLALWG